MKKRRARTKNSTHLQLQLKKLSQESAVVPLRSKSFQELKRRYITGNVQQKRKCRSQEEEILPLNKDTFDSLESFFDIKKNVHVPNIKSYIDYEHDETLSELSSTKSSNHSITNSYQYSSTHPCETVSNILLTKNYEPSNLNFIRNIIHLEGHPLSSSREHDNNFKMTDTNRILNEPTINNDDDVQRTFPAPPTSPETEDEREDSKDEDEGADEDDVEEEEDVNSSPEELTEIAEETQEDEAPEISDHIDPMTKNPTNIEDTISNPGTDYDIFKDLAEASNRCGVLEEEINQLQQELKALQQKEDLDEDDRDTLEVKRLNVMKKMTELDVMTRNIQETLGLVDPSTEAFAKAFEIFLQSQPITVEDIMRNDDKKNPMEEDKTKKILAEWEAWEDQVPEEDRFDFPQQEYPEDRLPRVIVCGYTEDEFPKIVVADSERRPSGNEIKCLENITGKLVEALDVQEKLAKENAQLEGGKYKLEEALIEKDDIADTLQRKVCGLQAEMRMIVKENSELSHQLAALNQRITNQLPFSPRSIHQLSLNTSRGIDNKSNKCQHCIKELHSNTVCVSPRDNKQQNYNSPRLCGGGSMDHESCNCGSTPAGQNHGTYSQPPAGESGARTSLLVNCPAEMENKLTNYETSAKHLAQQLGSVESEVRNMKMELANVQRERQQLEQQRKLLACTGPCVPCPCTPPVQTQSSQPTIQLFKAPTPMNHELPGSIKYHIVPGSNPSCTGTCINAPMGGSNCPQQQLRDLREQYARLQEDYKNKVTEVSCLRTDIEKLKYDTREAKDAKERAENRLIDLDERLKIFESDRNRFSGSKEQLMEQEQTLVVARQRYREAQDELEELRLLIQDQANQLEDYRNKYLQAQEQVEEQRRQIELMEMDNARMNENVTLEIGRVKNQFQEKLSELAPLPDILKQTQIKLQESQQTRLLAERNCEELTRELLNCKDKIGAMTSQSEILRTENAALKVSDLDNLEDKNRELRNENERIKNTLSRLEEREVEHQKRLDDKKHEIAQLSSMLEQVREDSARQVARTKERCETIRRRMQGEISEMEKQLVQCRATAKSAQKDRDEIRQKMQGQINHLSEAFSHAQTRVRNLQGHVNYLKPANSNSYCIGTPGDGFPTSMAPETHQTSYDPCDCNY